MGWLSNSGRPAREMSGGELDGARLDADFYFPVHISQTFSQLRVERPVEQTQQNVPIDDAKFAKPPEPAPPAPNPTSP